jgi:chromate transporter
MKAKMMREPRHGGPDEKRGVARPDDQHAYLLAGWTGAAVATLGIFPPAFVLVAASGPFVSLLRDSRLVAWLLDGVTVGAVALMAVVTWQLSRAAIMDVTTAVLAAGGAVLLLLLRLNSTWLIAAGAILGMIVSVVRAP